jgi:hypothetical protein
VFLDSFLEWNGTKLTPHRSYDIDFIFGAPWWIFWRVGEFFVLALVVALVVAIVVALVEVFRYIFLEIRVCIHEHNPGNIFWTFGIVLGPRF